MVETERFLSPSQINCYLRCPRLFYYRYVLRVEQSPSIHLYKGSLIHSLIEDAFKNKTYIQLDKYLTSEIKKRWDPQSEEVLLTQKENKSHYNDSIAIVKSFGKMFDTKLKLMLEDERIRDINHAWNSAKPTLSEFKIRNDELKIQGIIDSIETDFDGRTFIVDYKTSKKYKNMVSEEYVRQLSIYAWLYAEANKRKPDYVGINYLRYGEVYMFPVTQQMLDDTKQLIINVQNKTKSMDINDYPLEGDKFSVEECKEIEKYLELIKK